MSSSSSSPRPLRALTGSIFVYINHNLSGSSSMEHAWNVPSLLPLTCWAIGFETKVVQKWFGNRNKNCSVWRPGDRQGGRGFLGWSASRFLQVAECYQRTTVMSKSQEQSSTQIYGSYCETKHGAKGPLVLQKVEGPSNLRITLFNGSSIRELYKECLNKTLGCTMSLCEWSIV